MSGFTDYHAHFVYGVDDGAQTREEMYAMLDAAAADGVRHLFATSHSTPGMERFPQEIYDAGPRILHTKRLRPEAGARL